MPRDPKAAAMHRLYVAHANYEHARDMKVRTREQLNRAMADAVEAGISRAEVARTVKSSPQRVGAIVADLLETED